MGMRNLLMGIKILYVINSPYEHRPLKSNNSIAGACYLVFYSPIAGHPPNETKGVYTARVLDMARLREMPIYKNSAQTWYVKTLYNGVTDRVWCSANTPASQFGRPGFNSQGRWSWFSWFPMRRPSRPRALGKCRDSTATSRPRPHFPPNPSLPCHLYVTSAVHSAMRDG